jgi:hypothetical protein
MRIVKRIVKARVQARLDESSQRALALIVRRLHWTPSKVVREGIRLLAASQQDLGRPKIIGVGKFSSRRSDLGSNEKHLQGFGR